MAISFDAIRAEFNERVIGPLIQAEVGRAVRSATKRLPPQAYAEVPAGRSGEWTRDNIENLVQDVVAEQLLRQGQLNYAMTVASSLAGFRALMYRCVSRQVRLRRRQTAVDGLVRRARKQLGQPPYVAEGTGKNALFGLASRNLKSGQPEQAALYRAAQLVAALPRTGARDRAGTPLLLDANGLEAAIATIAAQLPSRFSLDDVRQIFELVFTDYALATLLPSYDASYEDWEEAPVEPARLTDADVLMADEAARAICAELDDELRMVLRLKSAEVSDDDVARHLGVSRPTAAKRKRSMQEVLRKHLQGLSDNVQDVALDRALLRIAVEDAKNA